MSRPAVLIAAGAVPASVTLSRANQPAGSSPAGHVHVIVLADMIPDHAEAAASLLAAHAGGARVAPGCLAFDLVRQAPPTANHFAIVQVWDTIAAQRAYAASEIARRLRTALLPLSASPFDERLYWDALP